MRWPRSRPPVRFRFTMRWLMVLVALVALGLGWWVAALSQWRSKQYLTRSQNFALLARVEADSETTLRLFAEASVRSARRKVDIALRSTELARIKPRVQPGGIDPGILAGKILTQPSWESFDEMARSEMEMALWDGQMARSNLDQANSAAQRARYFTVLAEKYRQAAAHPMRSLAPDPPEPK